MDSIVKRCLSVPEYWVWYEHHEGKYYEGGKWLHEAADEIERLREALLYIRDNWSDTNVDIATFYWKARAALGEKE